MAAQKKEPNNLMSVLDALNARVESSQDKFDASEHDSRSRLEITKLFLKWYFCLIAGSFIFSLVYNFWAASINSDLISKNQQLQNLIPYLDVSNTVSIITTTLSSGVGFVIGYYFKNKGE